MKVNEFLKRNRDLVIIYSLAILISVIMIVHWRVVFIDTGDSPSYVNAFDSFINGSIDCERTPVYPLFLGGLKFLFGETEFLKAAIIFQHLLFLVSIWFFYNTSILLSISSKSRFCMTLAYGCLPYLNIWGNMIGSESISITLYICFAYFLFLFLKRPKLSSFTIFFLLMLLLIFVRPAFLFVLPILLCVFCLYYFMGSPKVAIQGLIAVVVCSLLLVGYMVSFKKEHGVFSPTSVSLVNRYQIARIYNLIDTEAIENEKMKKDILLFLNQNGMLSESEDNLWSETSYLFERYQLTDISSMLNNSRNKNWKKEIIAVFKRFYRSCFNEITTRTYFPTSPLFGIRLLYIYLFTLFYGIVLFFFYKSAPQKHGMIPWLSLILLLFVAGNIAVVVIGAQSDWGRLFVPSLPLVLLMLGQIISPVKKESFKQIPFR